MSIHSQNEFIDKINTKLDNTNFVHNNTMYKLAGWCTDRDRANNTKLAIEKRIDYTDQQIITETNYDKSLTLYAVWTERDVTVSYGALSIKAQNIAYSDQYTTLTYSLEEIQTYDNGVVKSKQVLTGTDKYFVGTNGGESGKEETATSSRKVTVTYTHSSSGKTASTTITQTGYTPIYKIQYSNSNRGKIECYQYIGNKMTLITPTVSNNIYTCSSTTKNFILKAVPTQKQTTQWIANKGCAYYTNPANWLLHAAVYPKSNSCGSWKTTNEDLYELKSWSGGTITGKTDSQITVAGSVANIQLYSATFTLKPLLQNAEIGTWRKTWITYTTKSVVVQKTGYNKYWVPTCSHDTKRKKKGATTWDHQGWGGHGYWVETPYKYNVTQTVSVPNYHTNIYANLVKKELSAPYTFTIPADGILTIKGKYGINVYGCGCTRTGGFKILKKNTNLEKKWVAKSSCTYYNTPAKWYLHEGKSSCGSYQYTNGTYNSFDDFLCFSDTLNNEDKDFYAKFNVKKDDVYQFTKTFSSTAAHIAIYVEEMKLEETTEQIQTESSSAKYSNDIVIIDDMNDGTDKTNLVDKYTNNTKTDYSVIVCKAKQIDRDQDGKPNKTLTLNPTKQTIYQITLGGGSGWGYTRMLRISDAANNKVLKTISATGTTWAGDKGNLSNMSCKVYVPNNKKIKIEAVWTRVDTYNFDVWLDIKGVSFDKL